MSDLYPAPNAHGVETGWTIAARIAPHEYTGLYFPVYRTRAIAREVARAYNDSMLGYPLSVHRATASAGYGMRREQAEQALRAYRERGSRKII